MPLLSVGGNMSIFVGILESTAAGYRTILWMLELIPTTALHLCDIFKSSEWSGQGMLYYYNTHITLKDRKKPFLCCCGMQQQGKGFSISHLYSSFYSEWLCSKTEILLTQPCAIIFPTPLCLLIVFSNASKYCFRKWVLYDFFPTRSIFWLSLYLLYTCITTGWVGAAALL